MKDNQIVLLFLLLFYTCFWCVFCQRDLFLSECFVSLCQAKITEVSRSAQASKFLLSESYNANLVVIIPSDAYGQYESTIFIYIIL